MIGIPTGFPELIFVVSGLFLYLLPTVIAVYRQTDNIFLVGLLNVFLGATGIGWFIALYLAFKAPRHSGLARN